MSAWAMIAGSLAPLAAVIGVALTTWAARRSNRETTSMSLVNEIQDWTELRLKERDTRIDKLSGDVDKRDERIERLEKDLRSLRDEVDDQIRRYRSAIDYIKRIVRQLKQHVDPAEIESPPANIEPDLH